MSVHAGVFFFDGRPTDIEQRWIATSLQPLARDGVSLIAHEGVVLGYGACHAWSGDANARQPLRGESGHILVWDGRLDNRDDLTLRLHGRLAGDLSDASIALAVFERWGIEGLHDLIGDWSLVIWDSVQRALHVARDYMGVRPLYYLADAHSVMWSSNLGELAARSGRIDDLDEGFIARWMMLRYSPDLTPYRGIRPVPPAMCLSFSPSSERRQRFWSFDGRSLRYGDRRQYEEQLRELWRQAVGSRLRLERGTVYAELSGGFDSSSIVCMADALIRAGSVGAAELEPLSQVTFESSEGDERRFIAAVESKTDRRSVLFGLEAHEHDRGEWDWETPLASMSVDVALINHVRQRGGRVILTGRAGDAVMGCYPDHSIAVLDDWAERRYAKALADARLWSRATHKPFIEIATGMMRARYGSVWSSAAAPAFTDRERVGIELLRPRLRSIAMAHDVAADVSALAPSRRAMAAMILRYQNGALSAMPTPPSDIVYAHPYVHRPLVEFMLAIPGCEVSAPGLPRALMRRAFAGLVPDAVLKRISKGYYPPAVMRGLRSLSRSLPPIEQLRVVQRGWLDPQPLALAIRNLAEGGTQIGGVRVALLLEQWLALRERQGPAAMPTRKEVTTNAVLNA